MHLCSPKNLKLYVKRQVFNAVCLKLIHVFIHSAGQRTKIVAILTEIAPGKLLGQNIEKHGILIVCLLYTSPSPRD